MTRVIHQKVVLNMTVKKVFEMFTEPEKLKKWLVKDAVIEPFVGGKYELYWDLENENQNSTIGCKITAIEFNKLLAFEWKGPVQFAEFMNNRDPLTHVTISFFNEGDNTEVHLIHSGWGSDKKWEQACKWFDSVWKNAFTQLEAVISSDESPKS